MISLTDVVRVTPGSFCVDDHPCQHPNTTIALANGDLRIVDLTGAEMESLAMALSGRVFEGEVAHFSGLFRMAYGRPPEATDALLVIRRSFGQPEFSWQERLSRCCARAWSSFWCCGRK
jgi:hypothetical protein